MLRLTVTTYVLLCPPFSLSSGVQTLATVSSRYWSALVLAIFLLGSLMNLHICKDAERKTSSPFLSLLLRRLLRPRFPGVCHRVSHLSVLLCLEARQKDRLVSAFQDNITTARWSLPHPFTPAYHAVLSTGCYPLLATSIFKDRSQRCAQPWFGDAILPPYFRAQHPKRLFLLSPDNQLDHGGPVAGCPPSLFDYLLHTW